MINDLWQTITPVSVEASRWNYIAVAETADKFRLAFRLPSFSIAPIPWLGASYIVYEMRFSINKRFSFRAIFQPTRPDFVLAVRWSEGPTVHRYKFWEGISEILHYPLYTGQIIGASFVLEVWNIKNAISVTVPELTISSGILIHRNDCCEVYPAPYSLQPYTYLFAPLNPYATLPIVFTESLKTVPPQGLNEDNIWIITEDGKIILLG